MGVEEILAEMARNAGRVQLQRGQILGDVINSAAQIPRQYYADQQQERNDALRRLQVQQQMQFEQARAAREAEDSRRKAEGDVRDQAKSKAYEEHQQIVKGGLDAAMNGDLTQFDAQNAFDYLMLHGRPEAMSDVIKAHKELLPKLVSRAPGSVMSDELTGQVVTGSAIPEKKPDYTIGNQRFSGVDNTPLGDVVPAPPRTPGPGSVHDTPNGLVRIGDDNTVTPLGVKGYHPPPTQNVTGGLEPDAVDYTATQYRILGPSGIPTRIGEADKTRILNTAAKQAKALGQSPAQAVQKQAAYKADASSLTKMTNMAASAEAFETKANAQAELVRSLSSKVGRTDWPLVNGALLTGKELTGDTDAHLFANGLLTFTNEYAKIMEGATGSSAGSSVSARQDATKLISKALKDDTIDKTLNQMQWEMRQTREGYRATIDHISERMGGAPASPVVSAPISAPMTRTIKNSKTGETKTQTSTDGGVTWK